MQLKDVKTCINYHKHADASNTVYSYIICIQYEMGTTKKKLLGQTLGYGLNSKYRPQIISYKICYW